MITLLTTMMFTCTTPMFINDTNVPFNKHDQKIYNNNSCGKRQYYDTPCVKLFKKVGTKSYQIICTTGRPKR